MTHEYSVQGPVAMLLTTTAIHVDEELTGARFVYEARFPDSPPSQLDVVKVKL